jgi:hypothetical protein
MEKARNSYEMLNGKPEGEGSPYKLGIEGRIILK